MLTLFGFRELANLVKVGDVFSPFIGQYERTQSVGEVSDDWWVRCGEEGIDPMDQIGMVVDNGKPEGLVAFEDLMADKQLSECMSPISPTAVMSADTPILEAVKAFANATPYFYAVLRGNTFIGWLSYEDIHKLPFRLCLFALLISTEKAALDVLQRDPKQAISRLRDGRVIHAQEIYRQRGYRKDEQGKEHAGLLLDCTTFVDKFQIILRSENLKSKLPALSRDFANVAEKLRNEIAHASQGQKSSVLLKRESLLPFIESAVKLQEQLLELLGDA